MTDQPTATRTGQWGMKQIVSPTPTRRGDRMAPAKQLIEAVQIKHVLPTSEKIKNHILHSAGGTMIIALTLQ